MTSLIPSVVFSGFLCLSTQAAWTTILEEDFEKCQYSGGLDWTTVGAAGGTALAGFRTTVLPGWDGAAVYGAFSTNSLGVTNRMVKLGTTSALGWIETAKTNLAGGNGDFTVSFRAGAWDYSTEATDIDVEHHTTGGVEKLATVSLSKTQMQPFTVNGVNGTVSSSIRFTAKTGTRNRFFLDDVLIEGEASTLHIGVASVTADVLAGETVSAVVTATDADIPILAEVDDTNIPVGNPYSFDGVNFSWIPQVTGSFWVKFVAANKTESVDYTLPITVGLPTPNAPMAQTTPGSIYLTWDPVPGATNYTVQVYKLATEIEVFAEGFQECTLGASSGTLLGSASSVNIEGRLGDFGLDDWVGYSVYCAHTSNVVNNVTNYVLKFGTGSVNGWIQTLPLDLSANGGECTLTFSAGKWRGDTGSLDILHITDNGVTTNVLRQITGLPETALAKYTVPVTGGTAKSVISFTSQVPGVAAGGNRFFLDDVRLSYITVGKFEVPDSQIVYINGTTARAFGLPSYSEYLCTVTAMGHIGDKVSKETPARTTAATVIIMR